MSKARAILIESGLITPEELEQIQPLGTPVDYPAATSETLPQGDGDGGDDKDSDLELIAKVITRILARLFNLEKAVGR